MPEYGKDLKRIVFADTDKRHADLRLKLRRDGLSQLSFFQSIVTGYINNDPNITTFVEQVKLEQGRIGKRKIAKTRKDIEKGNLLMDDLGFSDKDKDFVFDLIENGGIIE